VMKRLSISENNSLNSNSSGLSHTLSRNSIMTFLSTNLKVP